MISPTPNPPRRDGNAVRRTARKLSRDIGIRARIIALRSDLPDADPSEEEEDEEELPQPQAPYPQAHAESGTVSAWWLNYIDERMKTWCAGERDHWREVLTRVIAELRERYQDSIDDKFQQVSPGPAGPQGERGEAGPIGPQGEPGILGPCGEKAIPVHPASCRS
jgi:hypothetical protein